jgi:hypothetical protein
MLEKENAKEDKKDVTLNNSSHILQLKYNPEGDSSIGFRYSKYKDSSSSRTSSSVFDDSNSNKRTCCTGKICKQIRLMTWKNYLVFSRNLKPSLFQLFTPVIICLILLLLQGLVSSWSTGFINKNPDLIPLNAIDKCLYPNDCTTIGYGIIVIYYYNF